MTKFTRQDAKHDERRRDRPFDEQSRKIHELGHHREAERPLGAGVFGELGCPAPSRLPGAGHCNEMKPFY